MKVAIWGTQKEGKYLGRYLQEASEYELICYIDNSAERQGKVLNGCRVLTYEEYKNAMAKENGCIVVSARNSYSRLELLDQLAYEKSLVGLIRLDYPDYDIPIHSLDEAVFWIRDYEKPVMPYLEYNVIDGCNLNCRGCSHFSSLFSMDDRITVEDFERDIKKIAEKVHLIQLRILGGEPLLHPDLSKLIDIARRYLPDTGIAVVTNGTLLQNAPESLFGMMREKNVGFHISRYQPLEKNLSQLVAKLRGEKVYYRLTAPITEFGKSLSMNGKSNPQLAMKNCLSLGCRFLRQGRLYKCPYEGLIERFAEVFGYSDMIGFERGFDIYDETINWKQKLLDYYENPVPMCYMCAETCVMYKWMVKSVQEKKDWIV